MTKVEWAALGLPKGVTWNPIRARNSATGKRGWHCEKVSPACEHCYAEALNAKAGDTGGTGLPYKPGHRQESASGRAGPERAAKAEIYLDEKTLLQPLSWRAARGVFVCSMTDIFGDWVKDEWLDRIFAVMALCSHHRFALLTKRPKRMRSYLDGYAAHVRIERLLSEMKPSDLWNGNVVNASAILGSGRPLPNIWLGVTAEDQPRADERIPDLLATPAAVRFVSIEPMLGPIDIRRYLWPVCASWPSPYRSPKEAKAAGAEVTYHRQSLVSAYAQFLDWVITGGESGKDARGTPGALFRSIRDQCEAARVAHFHKQNGEWIDVDELWRAMRKAGAILYHDGKIFEPETPLNYQNAQRVACAAMGMKAAFEHQSDGSTLIRVGKARAGRLLDGKEYSEFPEAK